MSQKALNLLFHLLQYYSFVVTPATYKQKQAQEQLRG